MTLITSTTKAAADQVTAANNNAQRLDILQMGGDYATSTGSANAYLLALDAAITAAYTTGATYKFKANFANTGAATININSIGVKTIKNRDGTDIISGQIASGALTVVQYDGTYMQLLSASTTAKTIDTPYTALEDLTAADRVSLSATAGYVERTTMQNYSNPSAAQGVGAGSYAYTKMCKVTVDKFAALSSDGTNWKLFIGTVNKETLVVAYGAAVTVNNASTITGVMPKVIYMSDDKIACLYWTADLHLRMRIATISGTTPTLGTEADLITAVGQVQGCSMCLIATDKIGVTALHAAGLTYDTFGCSISGTTITSDYANKIARTSGYNGATDQTDMVLYATNATITFTSHTSGTGGIAGTVIGTKFTWSGTVPTYVSNLPSMGSGGIDSYITAALTCSNAGNERILYSYYGSGPSYHARVMNPILMGIGTDLDLNAKYPTAAFAGTYYNLVCIEVDSTSGNNLSRCLMATNGGSIVELQTQSSDVYILGELVTASGSGNYAAICMIDSARKKIVHCCGTGVDTMARAEYDNTSSYVGCVRTTTTSGNSCAVMSEGNLDIFSGLTARTKYYFQPNSYTLTAIQKGPIAIEATDTTKANVLAKLYSRFSAATSYRKATFSGTGNLVVYHNLGVMPKFIKMTASGNPNIGTTHNFRFSTGTYKGGQENASGFVSGGVYNEHTLSSGGGGISTSILGDAGDTVTIYRINEFYMIINFAGAAAIGGVSPIFAFEFYA